MEFGLGLWGMQSWITAPRHHVRLYEEMLEDARLAEELGFDSIWLTEHHFWYDGYCPSLLVAAGAMAAATTTIKIGTGIILIAMHDPLRVAEAAAVADIISGGRLQMGVAAGYREVEFDGFGVSARQRGARVNESLDVIEAAWRDEPLSHHGRFYHYDGVTVTPKPVQRPIPIWLGGGVPAVQRRAGRRGYNIMPVNPGPGAFKDYCEAALEAGHDPARLKIAGVYDLWVDDSDAARDEIEPIIRYLYGEQVGSWLTQRDEEGNPVRFGMPLGRQGQMDHSQWRSIRDTWAQGSAQRMPIGTPDTVIRGLEQFMAANPEMNYICARIRWDGLPRARLRRCMELLAKEVVPHFRAKAGAK
ncbi:MAG: LLM class flavin-dependent oxidoreductase [Chloroflexi bacterium]|nr:LLM class flavin-dependent oxidoreductase [Chloroflexota bacterium]